MFELRRLLQRIRKLLFMYIRRTYQDIPNCIYQGYLAIESRNRIRWNTGVIFYFFIAYGTLKFYMYVCKVGLCVNFPFWCISIFFFSNLNRQKDTAVCIDTKGYPGSVFHKKIVRKP